MMSSRFKKILKLFDYFKIAYHLNTHNKSLYRPQIILIFSQAFLIVLTALSFLSSINQLMALAPSIESSKLFGVILHQLIGLPFIMVLLSTLIVLLGSTYVEAGLYKRYSQIVQEDTEAKDFISGANQYFGGFLLGNILIILFWIMAFIPYVIASLMTLTLGFTLIPLIVSTFLMVWKVILVSENVSVIQALLKSFHFGKEHFIPGFIYILIQHLPRINSGGSSNISSQIGNFTRVGDSTSTILDTTDAQPFLFDYADSYPFIKVFFLVLLSLFTITTIVLALIQMLFQIFFGLVTTVLYLNHWQVEEESTKEEVQHV